MRSFWTYFRSLAILVVMVGILLPSNVALAAQSQADIDAAAEAAVYISELEADGNGSRLYRWLHPDAREFIPKSAVVGWYENDFFPLNPQPISEITGVQFIDWTWPVTGKVYRNTAEISFVQPFGTGSSTTYQPETVRLVEEDGDWYWFFGRSEAFVNTQIARFPEQPSRSNSLSRSSSSSSNSDNRNSSPTSRSSSGCTMVELYPGYPMYRGVLTGMLAHWGGLGDWECLETLEQMDQRFDMHAEDQANLEAAQYLGINGQPEDWLWENWMQIEAVRGLPAQCYSCVLTSTGIVPLTTTIQPDARDPRILAGFWSGSESYVYRAMAFIHGWDNILNAPELVEMYGAIVAKDSQPGGTYLTIDGARGYALLTGGYTLVPESVSPQDQEFLMYQAFWAPSPYTPAIFLDAELSMLTRGITDWRNYGDGMPLREYMEEYYS